jgi:hypothetical protein
MQDDTEQRLQDIERRLLKLEQAEQRRAEAGLEFLRKMAATEPAAGATLPEMPAIAGTLAKTRRQLAKLERKAKFRKPRRRP